MSVSFFIEMREWQYADSAYSEHASIDSHRHRVKNNIGQRSFFINPLTISTCLHLVCVQDENLSMELLVNGSDAMIFLTIH